MLPAAASQSTCEEVLEGDEKEHCELRNCGLFASVEVVQGPVVESPRLLMRARTSALESTSPLRAYIVASLQTLPSEVQCEVQLPSTAPTDHSALAVGNVRIIINVVNESQRRSQHPLVGAPFRLWEPCSNAAVMQPSERAEPQRTLVVAARISESEVLPVFSRCGKMNGGGCSLLLITSGDGRGLHIGDQSRKSSDGRAGVSEQAFVRYSNREPTRTDNHNR